MWCVRAQVFFLDEHFPFFLRRFNVTTRPTKIHTILSMYQSCLSIQYTALTRQAAASIQNRRILYAWNVRQIELRKAATRLVGARAATR